MKIDKFRSETEWYILPAISVIDDNFGMKGVKLALVIYWLAWYIEIRR